MITKTITDFRTKFLKLVKGASNHGVDDAAIDSFLEDAVVEYSRIKTRKLTEPITGNDTNEYFLPDLLLDFDPLKSKIFKIEFPVDNEPPSFLKQREWSTSTLGGSSLGAGGVALAFVGISPTPDEQFLVTYSTPHRVSLDAGSTTVEDSDFAGLAHLQASYGALAIEAQLVDTLDNELGADSVDHKTQTSGYGKISMDYRRSAMRLLGVATEKTGETKTQAEGATLQWDSVTQTGLRYQNHPN